MALQAVAWTLLAYRYWRSLTLDSAWPVQGNLPIILMDDIRSSSRRPTIRDVAAQAGVSKSLVSLVFSDPSAVSEARRQRVLAAATELGFTPNFLARALATTNGHFVGILAANLHNPLFAEIVDLVRLELSAVGEYALLTSATLPAADGLSVVDQRTVRSLMDLRPKSVLVVGSIPDFSALSAIPPDIPIVVAAAIPQDFPQASVVRTNDAVGMRLAVGHLAEQGHKRITHISGRTGPVAEARSNGYLTAMRALGLERHARVEEITGDLETQGYEVTKRLLRSPRRPTAIAAFNDLLAIGALDAVTEWVQAGGEPIAVTGYDNTFLAGLRRYSLTTLDAGNLAIARQASNLLMNPPRSGTRGAQHLLNPTLVVRGSSTV